MEDIWDEIAAAAEEPPLSEAQMAELDRRLEEHRADAASAMPWAEVRERLYNKYG